MKTMPQDFEMRCQVTNYGRSIDFVMYKADIDSGIERVVSRADMNEGLTVAEFKNEALEISPLFKLTVPQVNQMMSNILSMFDSHAMKLDMRSTLEVKIAGLEKVIIEKDELKQFLLTELAYNKGMLNRFVDTFLKDKI